ncbi:6-hydroxymethylpterin diphosphokinase MptE-like protein [Candidatus Neomarinimicrobiota bacterium]
MNPESHTTQDINTHFEWEQRATINPYRHAVKLVFDRLMWDLNWKSWVSRRRLVHLKDQHNGAKAVIICNGPSLNKVDFSVLESANIFTFGLNKINLLFDRTSFRPSCICAMDRHPLDQNLVFYNQTLIPLFINSSHHRRIKFRKNVTFLNFSESQRKFARDCSVSMNQGYTITFAAMQLAFHMGFKMVGLIGCDHNFLTKGPPTSTIAAEETDPDHFHPDYFSNGVEWHLPDMHSMDVHYELARDTYLRYDRRIYNCTAGGKLEVFERRGLSEFLEL